MIAPLKPESWQLKDPRDYPRQGETCGAAAAATVVCIGVCVLAAIALVVEVLKR